MSPKDGDFSFSDADLSEALNRPIADVFDRYQGRPLAEVEQALEAVGYPDVPQIAQMISDGIKPPPMNLRRE